ncbi:MAG: S-layer protein, partial [Candidatus Aenigmarchaeota archaeon]|nr:S-layer protein [Candidatus Aenigmarchaeota archaeon]
DNIARLDTDPEIETAKTEKNLILVGGPAVNRLTAQALGLSYPSYGEASTIPENAAVIKLVNDAFTTGKVALIVAGWEAENTQAACSVLQKYDYDEYAPKLTGTAVKVTGTTSPTLAPLTEGNQTE